MVKTIKMVAEIKIVETTKMVISTLKIPLKRKTICIKFNRMIQWRITNDTSVKRSEKMKLQNKNYWLILSLEERQLSVYKMLIEYFLKKKGFTLISGKVEESAVTSMASIRDSRFHLRAIRKCKLHTGYPILATCIADHVLWHPPPLWLLLLATLPPDSHL